MSLVLANLPFRTTPSLGATMIRYILIGIGLFALIPIIWFAWWLGSPLFSSTEVNEEFPFATRAVVPANMTMADAEARMKEAASADSEVEESMAQMTGRSADQNAVQAELTGEFRDADSFHKGSGTATIFEIVATGERVLRFEDFRVTNGPDLRVLLANAANPESHSDLDESGYVELSELKGNVGPQNYVIPSDFDLSNTQSVVIYCNPFRVVFSVATLESPS